MVVSKKAMGSIITVSFLILVTILGAISLQTWYQSNQSKFISDVGTENTNTLLKTNILDIKNSELYIQTKNNLTITAIEIDGIDCEISGNYSGFKTIDISTCLIDKPLGPSNLVILTENSVVSKSIYLDENSVKLSNYFHLLGLDGSLAYWDIFEMNNILFLVAQNDTIGRELFVYGNSKFSLVADIYPGSSTSNTSDFVEYNGGVYFYALNTSQNSLYMYNNSGLFLKERIYSYDKTLYDGKIYFMGNNETYGNEVYVYNGTSISLVADMRVGGDFFEYLPFFTEYNNDLYMVGNNGTSGDELFKFNGTTISLAADLNPGSGSSIDIYRNKIFYVFENQLLFVANNGTSGNELYSYNGSDVSLVADMNSGAGGFLNGDLSQTYDYDGNLYMVGYTSTNGSELYVYNGTTISLVADVNPGVGSGFTGSSFSMYPYKNELLFIADNGTSGNELYSYDGSTVSVLSDINSGSSNSFSNNEFANYKIYKNNIYFEMDQNKSIYSYDGNVLNKITTSHMDAFFNFNPTGMSIFKNKLIFGFNNGSLFNIYSHDGSSTQFVINYTDISTSGITIYPYDNNLLFINQNN
jgi:ELWxxDGT repeat protein